MTRCLQPGASNFLAAVVLPTDKEKRNVAGAGVAWVDVSTGRFYAATFAPEQLTDQLARIGPAEVLVCDEQTTLLSGFLERVAVTQRPAWTFGHKGGIEALAKQFGTHGLEGFGFDPEPTSNDVPALRAAGAILEYLTETQKASLAHIDRLLPYSSATRLAIDTATRRSLELAANSRDGRRDGSLLGSLDRTVTCLGARLLADWLSAPLTERCVDQRTARRGG